MRSLPPSTNPHLEYSLLTCSVQPDDGRFKRPKHVAIPYTLLLCDIVVLIDWIYIYRVSQEECARLREGVFCVVLHYRPWMFRGKSDVLLNDVLCL